MIDENYIKRKLEEERALLEKELSELAERDPNDPSHWEALPAEKGETDFRDEIADRMEDMDERQSTVFALGEQLTAVNSALDKLTKGTYGRCEVCKNPIEDDRLEAMPSARTCKAHMEEELLSL